LLKKKDDGKISAHDACIINVRADQQISNLLEGIFLDLK
jgi:hypothetical protein